MNVVVLTGAGISAESGVPTFRDADGLWEGHRVEDVASPEAYDVQPTVVHRFYDARRAALDAVRPNPAHLALARLEEHLGEDVLVVTQNIDDLHERAGSTRVIHMHGQLRSALCRGCGGRSPWTEDLADFPPCPRCGVSELRPDVVWFGEIPYDMDRILLALQSAELFVSDRDLRCRLSGRRLRPARPGVRRAHARAQPAAERGDGHVPRGPSGTGG